MRSLLCFALAAALWLVPSSILGADMTMSMEGVADYDDNAFRSSDNEEEDVLFRLRPEVRLHEDRGEDVRYSLRYAVPFEFAVDNGEQLDDIDHQADGRLTYHVNDRVEVFADGQLRYLRSALQAVSVEDPSDSTSPLINTERERVLLVNSGLGMTYAFSPRTSGSARVSWDFFDPEREDRARNQLLTTIAQLSYVLAPKHSVGGGVVFSYQDFDDRLNIAGSQTLSYGIRASWLYRLDETTTFSITVGPSLLQSEQDDADSLLTGQPLIPFAEVGDSVTGKFDRDGVFNSGTVSVGPDSIAVGRLQSCTPLAPGIGVTNVGGACPLDIVLDSDRDPALVAAIRGATASVVNTDPDGESDTSFNVFGEMTLRKDWSPTLNSAIRYVRQQGGASGLGGAVIEDALSLANTWKPSEKWEFSARADWSLRESVFEQSQVLTLAQAVDTAALGTALPNVSISGIANPGGTGSTITLRGSESRIDTMRWGVSARAVHRFSRNTSAHVQLTYNQQESEGGTLGNLSDFDNFLARVGVRYVFEPIKLW